MLANVRDEALLSSLITVGRLPQTSSFLQWLLDGELSAREGVMTCDKEDVFERRGYWRALHDVIQAIETAPQVAQKIRENRS